jgi:hypothetical protein
MNASFFLLIALACLGLMTMAIKAEGLASITCSGMPVTIKWASSGNIQLFTLTSSYTSGIKATIVCNLSVLPISFQNLNSAHSFPYFAGLPYSAGNLGTARFDNTTSPFKVTLYTNSGYEQGQFNGATFLAPFYSIA